jgi:hypothetical protein
MTTPHFDGKADANAFFKDLKVPTTYLNTTYFMSNFIYFGAAPKKGEDGTYAFYTNMKDAKMPIIDTEDLALACVKIFNDSSYIGKSVYFTSDVISWDYIAATFSEVFGI